MTKFEGYTKRIRIGGKGYTVVLVKHGIGTTAIYDSYLSGDDGITIEMYGYPVDQRGAKENPHIFTPEEIMELAVIQAEDFVRDLLRHEQFQSMLYDFMDDVDENRRIADELART